MKYRFGTNRLGEGPILIRYLELLAFGLAIAPQTAVASAAAEPPRIANPRPAPPTPPNVLPLPPAEFDSTLAVGGHDLKARDVDTRLNVDVNVNGRGPYHFVVDSGADTSVVGRRIARDLELPLGTPLVLDGTTARNVVDTVKVADLTIGDTRIPNLELPALRESDVGGDGLIGIDALSEQRLMLDFEAHKVRVEDARNPIRVMPGDIVITAHRLRGQLIITHVRAGNVPLDAVIDTGSEVTIGNSALRDKLLGRHHVKFSTAEVTGVTGVTVPIQIATIDRLQLGPVTFQYVPIAFADVPPFEIFGLSNQPALLLGTDLLEKFRRVSLDFRARKVRFQLRKCAEEGIVIHTGSNEMVITRLSSNNSPDVCEK
jgi:predicted aspartyl protease